MRKKILLIVSVFTYIILMSNSISAVEYKVINDHSTSVMFSPMKKISKALERGTSFFRSPKRELKWFIETQDESILREKMHKLQMTLRNNPFKSTGIQLIFQLIIAVIASVISIVFVLGATLSILFSALAGLVVVLLVSLVSILLKIISNNPGKKTAVRLGQLLLFLRLFI